MTQETSHGRVSEKAHAYTPGLKVKRVMTISKTRQLPIPGEVCVEVGDNVSYDTIVARAQIKGNPEVVKAALLLGVAPEELPKYVTKKIGDKVNANEMFAAKNAFFDAIKKRVTSPVEGTVESISKVTGQVIVRGLPVPVEVDAYVPGKVVKVLPREGVVIETKAALIQGIFGVGGETHGKVKMAVGSPDEEIALDKITAEDEGTVLVGGSMVTLEALRKSIEVGVACIVVGGIAHKDLTTFIGDEIGVGITGQEEVGLTLVITEGFGRMRMSQRTFDLLRHFEGSIAAVNGSTQIRAGVMRPEIVIPHQESFEEPSKDELAAGMEPGTSVRIIREPYFGAIGKVVGLPVELKQLQSESHVRVLEVRLDSGEVTVVPRANVEIIEE